MKGIVWYKDKTEGFEKLKEIQQQYEKMLYKTTQIKSINNSFEMQCENGDFWIACPARDCFRGHKCNISYIQRGIPENVISTIIRPSTVAYPYQAFKYWGDKEDEL